MSEREETRKGANQCAKWKTQKVKNEVEKKKKKKEKKKKRRKKRKERKDRENGIIRFVGF